MEPRKIIGKVLFCLVLIALLSAVPFYDNANAAEKKIGSNVHILFDLSSSYFNKEYQKQNKRVLNKSFDVYKILSKRILNPIKFQVFVITESSNENAIMCDFTSCKTSLFGKKEKDASCQHVDALKKLFAICIKKIMSQNPKPGTDITGAIDLSARIARDQSPDGDQTIIILSDFIEDRGDLPAPNLKLNDFEILLVYRDGTDKIIGKSPRLPGEAAIKFASKLMKLGAEKVIYVDERSDFGRIGSKATRELH